MKKRQIFRRALCGALAALALSSAALASNAYGPEVYRSDISVGSGTTLSRGLFWSDIYNTLRSENYLLYSPNTTVIPVVDYGGSVVSTTSLAAVETRLTQRGMTLAAGINGDYFIMATGESLGLLVTDGTLRSTSSYHPALGFRADGSALIGYPRTKTTVMTPAGSFGIADVNKARTGANCILYTPDYAATTRCSGPGLDVILEMPADSLAIGSAVTGTVREVVSASGATAIPAGCWVLSLAAESGDSWRLGMMEALRPGDQVTVTVEAEDPAWNDVTTAIGGMYLLVENGTAVKGLESSTAARTAAGIRADGSVLFYNSPSSAQGAPTSLDQVAVRLQELGCVTAICLDGGGSATMAAVYPGGSGWSVVNGVAAGSLRSCSNYLVLAGTLPADGIADSLWLYPYDAMVLSGASVTLTPRAADRARRAAPLPGSLTWSCTGGTVTDGGIYTAADPGTQTVTVSGGGLTPGTATMKVVSVPDSITVKNEKTGAALTSLTLADGESVDLTATAYKDHIDLVSQDTCFSWTVEGDVGTISPEGLFTAERAGTGTLVVAAGGGSARVTVRGQNDPVTLADFETGPLVGVGENLDIFAVRDREKVAFGEGSTGLAYDLSGGTAAVTGAGIPKPAGKRYLTLSVYGDGSGNVLSPVLNGAAAGDIVLDFTGWRTVTLPVAGEAAVLEGFRLTGGGSGIVYLDQIVASNNAAADMSPPRVTLALEGTAVTAAATDDTTGECALILALDGVRQLTADGTLRFSVPQDGLPHRITVTAVDAYGNRGEATLTTGAAGDDPFADMAGHWSENYVSYLYAHGIVSGIRSGNALLYEPDSAMTRAQFAVILANYLRVDPDAYASVSLPFADAADIPAWALPGVRAMFALGVVRGSAAGDGTLRFLPGSSITRAEAFTMIARTQPKGYAAGDLTVFADGANVPAWAADAMETLVGRGVVSGAGGMLSPGDPVTRGQVAKILCSLM